MRSTDTAREAEAAGGLTILPTGDGMALVFTGSVEEPVECALEISQALHAEPSLPVRMGIHSGPIHHVTDANGRENIAGVGINIAQRVMDCGDAGHIWSANASPMISPNSVAGSRTSMTGRRGNQTRSRHFVGQSVCRDHWQSYAAVATRESPRRCSCLVERRAQRTLSRCARDLY